MSDDEACIEELYLAALKLMHEADSKPRGDERLNLYTNSKKLFDLCLEKIESLSLFSNNETIDDVSTKELKYLLVPAYLCKIMLSKECSSHRLETFTQAREYAIRFLNQIIQYGFQGVEKKLEEVLKYDRPEINLTEVSLQDAMRSRDEKIEKYRSRKLLESRIEEIEKMLKQEVEVDDELNREYYLKLMNRWIDDTLDSLNNEIRLGLLLERNRPVSSTDEVTKSRPEMSARNETITIVKDSIQKQVFGLGYPSRPTVTVDEFISEKLKSGDLVFEKHKPVYSNSLQRYAEQPNLRREQEDLSDTEREEKLDKDDQDELVRLRKWDEFKDETPRGSGNRQNMG